VKAQRAPQCLNNPSSDEPGATIVHLIACSPCLSLIETNPEKLWEDSLSRGWIIPIRQRPYVRIRGLQRTRTVRTSPDGICRDVPLDGKAHLQAGCLFEHRSIDISSFIATVAAAVVRTAITPFGRTVYLDLKSISVLIVCRIG
jgi:hypothetical protein